MVNSRDVSISKTREQAVNESLAKAKEVLLSSNCWILFKFIDGEEFGGSKKEKVLITIVIQEEERKDEFEDTVLKHDGSWHHLNIRFYDEKVID